ncbi:MAG: PAS domain-containing protein [Marivibrio sp.]
MTARLAAALAAGDAGPTTACFTDADAPAPVILFDPDRKALGDPTLETLYASWRAIGGRAGRPPPGRAFDPLTATAALPYVMLLDSVDDGADLIYRVYGRAIAERFGADLTGKRLSETPIEPRIAAFFLAVYRAVALRRAPMLTEHAPPRNVSVASWRRLVLPLAASAAPEAPVASFLVGNIPGVWRTEDRA